MVEAIRRGASLRATARRFRISLSTLQRWLARAHGRRLDRVDFADRRPGPRQPPNRTGQDREDQIVDLRRELKDTSALGEYGAEAIHRELVARGTGDPPSVRTIGRILERRGLLDARRRTRRPAPPPGWYLPEVAAAQAELDSFDMIDGLVIQGGPAVEVFTGVSLHGGLVAAWPLDAVTAKASTERIIEHWRAVGLPAYAQFDNDTRFQGPRMYPDSLGRVARLCLSLQVVPVYVPPQETGFQAAIESFNGRWQAKVWARFHHAALTGLQEQSDRYVAASRQRSAARIDAAPERRPFPADWQLDLQARLVGRLVFLRRTNAAGEALLLGRTFAVDPRRPHRLVRAEVDLDALCIRFYALRRRAPAEQPLLCEVAYTMPHKRFKE
jgi:hypothetical protein